MFDFTFRGWHYVVTATWFSSHRMWKWRYNRIGSDYPVDPWWCVMVDAGPLLLVVTAEEWDGEV